MKEKGNVGGAGEAAVKKFAEMIIKRIGEIDGDWKTPWITSPPSLKGGWPQNISGRKYNGSNSIMLLLQQDMMGYSTPVYMTFKQATDEGCTVKKGEKSLPIFYYKLSIKNEEGKYISVDDYNQLSKEEQKKCNVRPFPKVFHVFNVEQTNYPEIKPDKWQELKEKFTPEAKESEQIEGEMFSVKEIDEMIRNNGWVCPIKHFGDKAFFRPSTDEITVPFKKQFINGEEYYSTLIHEMAHSTGVESRLNRDMSGGFGSKSYGREELVAELTSALCCHQIGIANGVDINNVKYIKNWMSSIKEEPNFLMKILGDVSKASAMINEKVFGQDLQMEQVEETEKKEAQDVKEGHMNMTYKEIGDEVIEQWKKLKEKHPNTVLLFRIGKNYEAYKTDIEALNKIGVLSTGGKASFKDFELDGYLPKLIRAGYKVAICDSLASEKAQEQKNEELLKIADKHFKSAYNDTINEIKDKYSYSDDFIKNLYESTTDEKIDEEIKLYNEELQDLKGWKDCKEIGDVLAKDVTDSYKQMRVNGIAQEKGERLANVEKNIEDRGRAKILRTNNDKELCMAHLGNGITLWEKGVDEYKAHISVDRKLAIYDNYKFSDKNLKKIDNLIKNGNYIVNNNNHDKDFGFLVLEPLNKPTLQYENQAMRQTYRLSVEKVDGKEYACYGRQIFSDDIKKYQKIEEKENTDLNINNLNQSTMAKKNQGEGPAKEAKQDVQAEQRNKDGVSIFKMQNGFYGINVTKDGERSVTHRLSQEDTEKYFEGLKGQPKEEVDKRREELAKKYFSEGEEKQKAKDIKPLPTIADNVRKRITEASVYKMQDGKNYGVRCKIDGEQQSAKRISPTLVSSFFDGLKGMPKEQQDDRKAIVAAECFKEELNAPKQELSQGMKR
mgnify:CR=1 FL=1|jgi:antirestriction protein ArdC